MQCQSCSEWESNVNKSIASYSDPKFTTSLDSQLTASDLFTEHRGRYTIKACMLSEFRIFPWLLPPIIEEQRRESLSGKRGETIARVVEAYIFLRNEVKTEEDYNTLREYYLTTGTPGRILWGIVEAKNHLDKFHEEQKVESKRLIQYVSQYNLEYQRESQHIDARVSIAATNLLQMVGEDDPLYHQKTYILSNIERFPPMIQMDLLEKILDRKDNDFQEMLVYLLDEGFISK